MNNPSNAAITREHAEILAQTENQATNEWCIDDTDHDEPCLMPCSGCDEVCDPAKRVRSATMPDAMWKE